MRALLSVSEKAGLVEFARGLTALNCELISTGGTAKALADAGLRVTAVSDVTGFPEMMDGRVKTLHPKIHGGILARRNESGDMAAIASQGITPIDVVVVNLYPFEETAKRPDATFEELIENIDIGGPSMIRAAAKNFRDVLVVVDPDDYPRVLEELRSASGPSAELRRGLMQRAFAHTAHYDDVIAKTMANRDQRRALRYGENPHQKAYALEPQSGRVPAWQVHQGKELSYTNLLDLDAAARIVREFTEPAAVVIKHTNPCGAATAQTIADAYVRARDADSLSAFGGIVGLNRALDEETARALTSTFIEAVIAPALEEKARPILAAKQNLRVATINVTPQLDSELVPKESRSFFAGTLVQDQDRVTEARDPWPRGDFPKLVTKRQPTKDEWQALRFAWRICAHVKSNAVIFTAADRTLAIGAGQMSRVDAVKVAVMKASGSLKGSVAASDAFFPFRDGLDEAAAAGATAVVQPGGSVRDAEVIAAADEHGMAMVFTGIRHFRH
ncbi:MAG TPA: bifunctional phosphoribosylaminoimidazolecarboxamide formyltransferase/IMP cyclohydrolase [Vicinamibacterales bacterium]|jgi:phosphoribosylaminoimidazolecarboxamide formyltransferase/IMP cyclohydrolase|nr:bifunctional phosphoribosylaminoimidazolecarboxamide formyltransferase/IMP cyclohydrolase [Vicinamibacterales bacterium]